MAEVLTDARESGAVLSPCGLYRYALTRRWGSGRGVTFVMLNPSTADSFVDDPTVRRCLGFARRWGCGRLWVVNLFALRTTDPAAMAKHPDPVGPDNDAHTLSAVTVPGELVVCAWGAHGWRHGRGGVVTGLLARHGVKAFALGMTKEGFPRHPLYVRADAELVPFPKEDADG